MTLKKKCLRTLLLYDNPNPICNTSSCFFFYCWIIDEVTSITRLKAWGNKNQIEVSILAGNKLGDKTSRRYTRQVRALIDRFQRKQ